ncbi:MAG TPA: hypothetical protein VGC39_07280 [Candidatus Methylacidiphilales bacterium]
MLFALGASAPLVAIENNGNYNNNTDPGSSIPNWTTGWGSAGIDGWNYIGQVNGASATYLGGGWFITAGHVGAGNVLLNGVTYNVVTGSATGIPGGSVDLVLFRVASPPSLPPLHLRQLPPSFFSAQNGGDAVALLGYGGGRGETWGLNTVNGINFPFSVQAYLSTDFYTIDGTTTIGTQSVTNNAQVVTGDSGGGDFIYNASAGTWELAGINEAIASSSYFVQLNSYVQAILDLTGLPASPVITSEPGGDSTYVSWPVSFSVGANGSSPLSYQWLKNGVAISGATDATYAIPSAALVDGGSYAVIVSNPYGSVSSTTVSLAVAALALNSLPAQQIVMLGQGATYSISTNGTGPFLYQWTKNGFTIPGATGAAYTIANVTADSAGNYAVTVTNSYGGATSNISPLIPVVSQQFILPGQSATFTATSTGLGPFAYQWFFDGTPLPGATGESYSVTAAQPSQFGIYMVTVTNPSGSVSSNFSLAVEDAGAPALSPGALAALALLLLIAAWHPRRPGSAKGWFRINGGNTESELGTCVLERAPVKRFLRKRLRLNKPGRLVFAPIVSSK